MTDIYGTLGPSCASVETLTQMFGAGMTGIRLNLSHAGLRASGDRISMIHEAARRACVRPKILMDMQGPELRIGVMAQPVEMTEGERVTFGKEAAGRKRRSCAADCCRAARASLSTGPVSVPLP